MDEGIPFRFSIQGLPDGKALTGQEIEKELLKSLEASHGTSLDSLWGLAVLYQQTGNLDQASGCMRRYIELIKDVEKLGASYLALGQLEESRRDFVAAAKFYLEALTLEPCSDHTWYFIHNNLGYSLNQTGQYAAATSYLQRAVEIDHTRPNAYKNLGLAHQGLGNLAEAAEFFIAATQANAADSRSLDHLTALLEANPALEVDVPNLRERVEACRRAAELAKGQQPDFVAHWTKLRARQKAKWWQFWKR